MITRIQKLVPARMIAMLLLVFWCAMVVAPLASAASEPQFSLPICCRSHGDHHCSGLQTRKDAGQTRVSAHCPHAPLTASVTPGDASGFAEQTAFDQVDAPRLYAVFLQAQRSHSTLHSANSQRGPPA